MAVSEQVSNLPIYHVVFKACSAARFRRETEQIWFNVGLEQGPVQMRVRTRFTDEGHEAAIPRELFIEMRGPAVGMNVAIDTFGPVAAEVANVARGGQKPRFVLDHPGTIG